MQTAASTPSAAAPAPAAAPTSAWERSDSIVWERDLFTLFVRNEVRVMLALPFLAALFALVVLGAYYWHPGQTLDEEGLAGFVQARDGWLRPVAWRFTELGNPIQVAAITLALAAVALVRGRPRLALGVLALIAATSVSSELLKMLLAHPRFPPIFDYPVGPRALPSGHGTAAMSLASIHFGVSRLFTSGTLDGAHSGSWL